MLFLNIPVCESSRVLSVLLFVKTLFKIAFILVPMILIIMLAVDLLKIVLGNGDVKKSIPMITSRIISTCGFFFVPVLAGLFVSLLGNVAETYTICLENATTENIEFYKGIEEEKEKIELQKLEAEHKADKEEREKLAKTREEARKKNEEKAEEERKKQESSSSSGETIEGTAKVAGDILWNVNDVTQKSNITSTQLIAVLNSAGGNAKNFVPYATDLVTAENKYSVNVFFLLGVEALESGWITSNISKSCNNLGGVCSSSAHPSNGCGSNSNCSFAYFSSPGEFILYHADMLHRNYLTPGGSYYHGTSPSAVVTNYCPGCSSWPGNVTSIANSLFNHVSKVI